MVSLPGDVAPERFAGFYGQEAPARALMRRQYGDIPPQNFLLTQSGLNAGIADARNKLRNINGFMHATTSYDGVQNAPHHLRMRWRHVAERNAERAAQDLEHHRRSVHSTELAYKNKRPLLNKAQPYKSYAAGLKLKQALREVTKNGKRVMQQETIKPVKRIKKSTVTRLLQKIAGVANEPDEGDLSALKEHDDKLQTEIARLSAAGSPNQSLLETARRVLSARSAI